MLTDLSLRLVDQSAIHGQRSNHQAKLASYFPILALSLHYAADGRLEALFLLPALNVVYQSCLPRSLTFLFH